MYRKLSSVAAALLAVGLLQACGGGDDAAPPAAAQPEETREQDKRVFTMNAQALPFDALADAPETDRWWGLLGKSGYRIEVPRNWNGMLVMYAHGYNGIGAELRVTPPSIRRHLIEQGYAWAASSYSTNFYDVRAGVEDTNALALAFNRIAQEKGRALAAPRKVYLIGHSMGGHVTAAAIDEEAARTANHKMSYHGAVPMCGVLGDTDLFNNFAAYQVAAQQLAGLPATSWPVTNWSAIQPLVRDALFSSFPATTTPLGDKYKAVVRNLSGGARPIFDQGFAHAGLHATVWGTFGRDGKINGILNQDLVSTEGIVYQLDNDPAQSVEEQAFNASAYRVKGTPEANRLRRDGLRWVPKTNGNFRIPVVTIHTLGDLYVPFSMEQIFKRRADANGSGDFLVQRAIRSPGHCDFTVAEQVAAFDAMANWEQKGVKPEGDDVLDAAKVADAAYGCRFTDNRTGTDDNPSLGTLRASLPECPRP
ncbi:alpha/beta hydrolase [Caldimonas tepidiphila]|uniref:alpha/beta hydrolase n=1 Tax=Caldimonas tepidiphila TaxID=2315841 RepID=UPI000E5A918D|nr:alpha/beta hydrolase [Caldimonas tepidiphila]